MKESDFQILGQRLLLSKFEANRNFSNEIKDIQLQISSKVDFSKDEINRKGIVNLSVQIFDEKMDEHMPFFLLLEIEGLFVWNGNLENVDNYLKINAPAVLMSHLRSIVIQLTVMAGLPPLNLPLINFSEDDQSETPKKLEF